MRFMIIVKASTDSEAGVMPGNEVIDGMGQFNQSLIDRGLLVAAEGLQASSKGARVRYSDRGVTVIDGPFTETKELIAGFWIVDVRSRDEAIGLVTELMRQVPFEEGEEIEIRKVFEASDWQEAGADPVQIEKEQELRRKAGGA